MNSDIKDKSAFVVALLAAALAFITFKSELTNINISLGFYQINFLQILIIFFVILTLSAYFYALDYTRYGFGVKIQNNIIFKWILPLANLLYVAALLFPLIIFVIWLISLIIASINISAMSTSVITFITSFISVIIGAISALLTSKVLTKNIRHRLAEKLEIEGENQFHKAHQLYKNQFYAETILELFKVVELNIRKKFEEKGFITKHLSPIELKWLSAKEKILTDKNLANFDDLRNMRNNAAHQRISFTKENADSAFNIVKNILEEIDKN